MSYTYTITNTGKFSGKEFKEADTGFILSNTGVIECSELCESFSYTDIASTIGIETDKNFNQNSIYISDTNRIYANEFIEE